MISVVKKCKCSTVPHTGKSFVSLRNFQNIYLFRDTGVAVAKNAGSR